MNNEDNKDDALDLLSAAKQLVPIVGATVVVVSAFFNLQSQVENLRIRMDLQTKQYVETLTDIKTNIKDLKDQLRDLQLNKR